MKIKKRGLFIGLGSIATIAIGGLVAVSFYFYSLAVERNEKDFLKNHQDLAELHSQTEEEVEAFRLMDAPQPTESEERGALWIKSKEYKIWNITSEDGLKLAGYYIPNETPTTKTVILAHGYSSKGTYMETFAKFYYEKLGYNVLMPDARGHGDSEGNYIGFGWPDRKDYLLWIQKVVDTAGTDTQIALHGISMGGATVMMISGEALPSQVKVVVEDCGYTSVYDQLAYQMDRMYNLPAFPILHATSLLTDLKAGYNFYEASALKQVKKSQLPMLFIHGNADTFVPTKMAYELYNACNAEKDIYIVEGAGHGAAYETDPSTYEKKVAGFVGRFIQ